MCCQRGLGFVVHAATEVATRGGRRRGRAPFGGFGATDPAAADAANRGAATTSAGEAAIAALASAKATATPTAGTGATVTAATAALEATVAAATARAAVAAAITTAVSAAVTRATVATTATGAAAATRGPATAARGWGRFAEKDCAAGEVDPAEVVDFGDHDGDFITGLDFVLDGLDVVFTKLGDVDEAFLAGKDFDKDTEVEEAGHLAGVDLADLHFLGEAFDHADRCLGDGLVG